jgi:predicted transcriptional regulator
MAKESALSVRLDSDLKAAIDAAAKADHRPVANLVEKILREWATAKGLLPAEGQPPSR